MSSPSSPLPPVDSSRLVTLSDGRPGLRGGIHIECREPAAVPPGSQPATPQPSATLEFVASDETLDRSDEIVMASGWKLDSYQRNPVFQNAHKYGDIDRKSTRLNSSHVSESRMPSSPFKKTEINDDVKAFCAALFAELGDGARLGK